MSTATAPTAASPSPSPFGDIVAQLVTAHLASPAGSAAIQKAVADTVDRTIRESLGQYSPLGKQISEAVSKCLALHGELDLPSYGHAILKIVEKQVEAATKDSIKRQVAERMKDLLTPAPDEIKLSELVEQYRQYLKEREAGGCICDTAAKFMFKISEKDGFFNISLSEDEDDRYPDIKFGIYIGRNDSKSGTIYTMSFDGAVEVENKLFVGPLYSFQRTLFQMQAAKTRVVIDVGEGDVDTSYSQDD